MEWYINRWMWMQWEPFWKNFVVSHRQYSSMFNPIKYCAKGLPPAAQPFHRVEHKVWTGQDRSGQKEAVATDDSTKSKQQHRSTRLQLTHRLRTDDKAEKYPFITYAMVLLQRHHLSTTSCYFSFESAHGGRLRSARRRPCRCWNFGRFVSFLFHRATWDNIENVCARLLCNLLR